MLQVKSHSVPLQNATEFAGGEQGLQMSSHCCWVTHLPSQSTKPSLQAKPHAPVSQVALALGTAGHASQDAPQDAALSLATHVAPQAWVSSAQAQIWVLASQEPGVGQSVGSRQPGLQVLSVGSQ